MLKTARADQLVAGLREVAAGEALLAPTITRRLIERFARSLEPEPAPPPGYDELTAREREVLLPRRARTVQCRDRRRAGRRALHGQDPRGLAALEAPRARPRRRRRARLRVGPRRASRGPDYDVGRPRSRPLRTAKTMAWDFSTEPEFEEQLEWMRAFVREEIWPIEPVVHGPRPSRAGPHLRAAAGGGQAPRAVGRAPSARPRRPGLRPGQARPHARDPGLVAVRAQRLRQPGARLGQLRGPRAGRHRRAEGALAAPAAGGRPQVGLLDDRARERGLGPDRDAHGAPSATATAGSSTATSGSPRTPRSPTSSSSWRSPSPTRDPTSAPRCSSCPSTPRG